MHGRRRDAPVPRAPPGAGGPLWGPEMDAEENTASGALCALVARGQALLVELLRLTDRVPPPFRAGAAPKFAAVLFDFAYLKARPRNARFA